MLDPQLAQKYNIAVPRYTSYPTAVNWNQKPSAAAWVQAVQEQLARSKGGSTGLKSSEQNGGMALYLHIPFCEKLCTFCGCNTRITRNHGIATPYIQTLLKEWQLYQQVFGGEKPPLLELHLGGGTPTFLSPDELKALLEPMLAGVNLASGYQFSIEVDPRVTTEEHLEALAGLGFKRISLGVQDFDPEVQKIVNREQSVAMVSKITEDARKHGFDSVNFDLIYGLPLQRPESIQNTFEEVIKMRPDRIAFYSYAHVPWIKPTHRRFSEADLPQGVAKRALYELGRGLLEGAGYLEVGMDHFALPEDALFTALQNKNLHRNFMGYTENQTMPLIGLGVSSISDAWGVLVQNEKILEKYQSRIHKNEFPILRGFELDATEKQVRRVILELMTQFEAPIDLSIFDTQRKEKIQTKLADLENDGLILFQNSTVHVTQDGRPFIRNICSVFDLHYQARVEAPVYSKSL